MSDGKRNETRPRPSRGSRNNAGGLTSNCITIRTRARFTPGLFYVLDNKRDQPAPLDDAGAILAGRAPSSTPARSLRRFFRVPGGSRRTPARWIVSASDCWGTCRLIFNAGGRMAPYARLMRASYCPIAFRAVVTPYKAAFRIVWCSLSVSCERGRIRRFRPSGGLFAGQTRLCRFCGGSNRKPWFTFGVSPAHKAFFQRRRKVDMNTDPVTPQGKFRAEKIFPTAAENRYEHGRRHPQVRRAPARPMVSYPPTRRNGEPPDDGERGPP